MSWVRSAPMRNALIVVLAAALVGCSSVPDVIYVDDDAGADGSSSGGAEEDSGTDELPSQYRCPDAPPPTELGVCCGTRVCLKCTEANCDRCAKAACTGDDVCCAKNAGQSMNVDCRRQSSCG